MSKKIVCKVISLTMALTMLLTVFTGCGQNKDEQVSNVTLADSTIAEKTAEEAQKTGWAAEAGKPITFDWYLNFSWYPSKWGTSDTSKYITEKTGVNINFIVPAGNETDKLNAMIASNSLPDLLTLDSGNEGIKRMVGGELIQPLNKLADEYDKTFYDVAPKSVVGWFTKEDGNLYQWPNFATAPERVTPDTKIGSNKTFLVRKDMYEAIGKPDMTTPEGFLKALQDAKAKFPTVNGQPLIALGAHEFGEAGSWSFDSYIQDFLAIPKEKDGKIYDRLTDPEYIRWMKTFRKANELGLVSKDIFVDKRAQMDEKMNQGRYFAAIYQSSDCTVAQQTLYAKDPNTVYIAVDAISNTKLDKPTLYAGGLSGWTSTMISNNCKDSSRAIKLFTYLISEEGQKDMYLGRKGFTWDTIDGRDQLLPEVAKLKDTDRTAFDEKYASYGTYWMFADGLMITKWSTPTAEPYKQPEDWAKQYVINDSVYAELNPTADSEEGIALKKVNDKWGLIQPKLLLAKSDSDFDKFFAEFLAERDKLGYAKVLEFQNKKLQANKTKLGE